MIGPGKQQLYAEGKLTLADLVGVKDDAQWGRSRYQRSLREIQAGTQALRANSNALRALSGSSGSGGASTPQQPNATPRSGRFATLEEAHAWATQTYPHITWDFEGAHIDAINPTLDQFHKLAQEWPGVAARLKYVGTHQGTNALYPALKDKWSPNHLAHANDTYGSYLGLNPAHYGNPASFLEELRLDVEDGWHPKGCDAIEYVLTHEFGHLIEPWLRTRHNVFRNVADINDGFGVVNGTFTLWLDANKAERDLSRYAQENYKEGWAEGFAAIYHMPRHNWPIFVQRQRALLTMIQSRPTSYKWLHNLRIAARTLAKKSLTRDRKRLGI